MVAGSAMQGEVAGIIAMVRSVMQKTPPGDNLMHHSSEFTKQALARCVNFLAVTVPDKRGQIELVGRKALEWHYNSFKESVDKGMNLRMSDVKAFRHFTFALPPKMKTQFEEWVSNLIRIEVDIIKAIGDKQPSGVETKKGAKKDNLDAKDQESDADDEAKAKASSASSGKRKKAVEMVTPGEAASSSSKGRSAASSKAANASKKSKLSSDASDKDKARHAVLKFFPLTA